MTDAFNAMRVDVAVGHLLTCLDVPRRADEVERAETINQLTQIALLRFREVMS